MTLALGNKGTEAAHFAIHAYGGELPAPAHLDVRRDHVEAIAVDGPYEFAVQGPNRFWAELAGTADGAAAGLDVRAKQHGSSVELALVNTSRKPLTVKVKARGYGSETVTVELRGKQTRELDWPTDHGWYDVEVTTAEDTSYRRRLTGHLETGKPSITG